MRRRCGPGPKCHLVHYPLSGWKVFNLVVTCHNEAPEPVAGKPVVATRRCMQGFAHVHEQAQEDHPTTARTGGCGCCATAIRPSTGSTAGSTLLGDAAHPMMQYFAQGACMALEDAVCLSHMLASHPGRVEEALKLYCARRVLRTSRVQLQSRALGEHVYHPAGAHADLRNAVMRGRSQTEWYDALQWLYGSTGLGENNFG